MVYAVVSKTTGSKIPCEFDSHPRHHPTLKATGGGPKILFILTLPLGFHFKKLGDFGLKE